MQASSATVKEYSFGNFTVPYQYFPGRNSKTLFVCFHGAVNRERRKVPVFVGRLPVNEPESGIVHHQISIADPSLTEDSNHSISWYAGAEGADLQERLSDLINSEIADLGVTKIVLVGGSGGGFAALYYSALIPNSIALVRSPQTNIANYYGQHVTQYISNCWPSISTVEELKNSIITDVSDLYRRDRQNFVVYLQSTADEMHFYRHMIPFMRALSSRNRGRAILQSDFWGVLGHSNSVPTEIVWRWARAICRSEDVERDAILNAYHAIASEDVAQPSQVATSEQFVSQAAFTAREVEISRVLAAWGEA